jgi:hypothetical protein
MLDRLRLLRGNQQVISRFNHTTFGYKPYYYFDENIPTQSKFIISTFLSYCAIPTVEMVLISLMFDNGGKSTYTTAR